MDHLNIFVEAIEGIGLVTYENDQDFSIGNLLVVIYSWINHVHLR